MAPMDIDNDVNINPNHSELSTNEVDKDQQAKTDDNDGETNNSRRDTTCLATI